jgi:hypothetical protein
MCRSAMCPDHPGCRNPDKKILSPTTVSYDHIRLSHLYDQMIVSFETRVLSTFHMRIGQLFTETKISSKHDEASSSRWDLPST